MNIWLPYKQSSLEFCENLLDGFVRQPANTWSNIGFLWVSVWIWRRVKTDQASLRIFAIGAFLVGLSSAFFHLSMIFFGQFLDVSCMFLTVGILTLLNAHRFGWITERSIGLLLCLQQVLLMSIMWTMQGTVGESMFSVQVLFVFISEVALFIKRRRTGLPVLFAYRWWGFAAITYLLATFFWIMDIKKIWCVPDQHFMNGHVLWHFLNAVVIAFLYRFYEALDCDTKLKTYKLSS